MTGSGPSVSLNGGYVYRVTSPQEEPSTRISKWRFVQVKHKGGVIQRHLIGNVDGEGRVTTAVTKIDIATMQVTTESGRLYCLSDLPGDDREATFLYSNWLEIGGRLEVKDLSRGLLRLRRMRVRETGPSAQAMHIAVKMMVARARQRDGFSLGTDHGT